MIGFPSCQPQGSPSPAAALFKIYPPSKMPLGDMTLLRPIIMTSGSVEISLAPAVAVQAGESDEPPQKIRPSVKPSGRGQLSATNYAEAWDG